ncbi:hypothetical protein TRFO_29678 [Tritrichomonas foetus]|uniref:ABC transporter domain-containing protein n=1 Tax=Tritrichomonas foetus TaxID=1144522 RepID=A0A1J4JZV3_9EUKA|nr:hypothetical protein TRFO_29678 [Tritrichomonas foetus]|eukprot:OHT03022.1 hypothetical protein TRFO_29678 [Tritrichomonas foetus]
MKIEPATEPSSSYSSSSASPQEHSNNHNTNKQPHKLSHQKSKKLANNFKIFERAPFHKQLWTILRISIQNRIRAPAAAMELVLPIIFLIFLIIFAIKINTKTDELKKPETETIVPFAVTGGPSPNFGISPNSETLKKFADVLNSVSIIPFKDNITYFNNIDESREFILKNREVTDGFYSTEFDDNFGKVKIQSNGMTLGSLPFLIQDIGSSIVRYLGSNSKIGREKLTEQFSLLSKISRYSRNYSKNNEPDNKIENEFDGPKTNLNDNNRPKLANKNQSRPKMNENSTNFNKVHQKSNNNMDSMIKSATTKILFTFKKFPHKSIFQMDKDGSLNVAIFSTVQPISSLLTTGTCFGNEAETGLRDLLTFYGLSLFANELRWFIISVISVFIPAILFAISISIIIKVNFGLSIVFYLLESTSHSAFLLFLVALWPTQKMGNIAGYFILISFFVVIFLAFFTWLFKEEGFVPKYILSAIFPHACASYTMVQISSGAVLSFSDVSGTPYFPVQTGLIIMAVQTIVYFVLYILAERLHTRSWFPAPIRWKNSLKFTNQENKIKVSKIIKKYGKVGNNKSQVIALNGVSFEVRKGETVAIVGPNGAGKSTLINILSGTKVPTSGEVDFNGVNIIENTETMHQLVGFCPQDNLFYEQLTASEWVRAICELRNEPYFDFSDIFMSLGLDGQSKRRLGNMSGGNKRKACLAASLVCEPTIVILDEATSGVDFTSRTRIWSIISLLKNTTVIMATHTLEECEKIADKIVVVVGGNILECATPNELRQNYKCGYIIECEEQYSDKLLEIYSNVIESHSNQENQANYKNDEKEKNENNDFIIIEKEEGRARLLIPSEKSDILSDLLNHIDFKYLLLVQSLEEQIFKQIQDHESINQLSENSSSYEQGYISDNEKYSL